VPHFCQRDSTTPQGSRICFSSICATVAAFLRPGCLKGQGQPDVRDLAIVQCQATRPKPTLSSGRCAASASRTAAGDPHPRWLAPSWSCQCSGGGGHWSLVAGWDLASQTLLMNDPSGEADLVGGGFVTTAIGSGKGLRYSARNWGRPWMVEGPGRGWWLELAVGDAH
jgi:hypothetical protein